MKKFALCVRSPSGPVHPVGLGSQPRDHQHECEPERHRRVHGCRVRHRVRVDPGLDSATPADAASTLIVTCTNGTPYTVTFASANDLDGTGVSKKMVGRQRVQHARLSARQFRQYVHDLRQRRGAPDLGHWDRLRGYHQSAGPSDRLVGLQADRHLLRHVTVSVDY